MAHRPERHLSAVALAVLLASCAADAAAATRDDEARHAMDTSSGPSFALRLGDAPIDVAADPEFDPAIDGASLDPAGFQLDPARSDRSAGPDHAAIDGSALSQHRAVVMVSPDPSRPEVVVSEASPGSGADRRSGLVPPRDVVVLADRPALQLENRPRALDDTAALQSPITVVGLPLSERLKLLGRAWQREQDPGGVRSTSLGAEAEFALTNKLGFRLGYELLATTPGQPALDADASTESLYAQLRLKF